MFGNQKKEIKGKLQELYQICKQKDIILTPCRFNLAAALFQYNTSVSADMASEIIEDYEGNPQYCVPGEFDAFIASVKAAA